MARFLKLCSLFAASLMVGVSVVSAPLVAHAAAPQTQSPVSLSASDKQWINRIQNNLASVTTLRARFQQIAYDGQRTTGTAWLSRPGKMRFAYAKPSPLLLVANDGKVVFHDADLDQTTSIPLGQTPLGLLLRPDLKLSGDVTVTAFSHQDSLLQVTLVRTASPDDGSLTLILQDNPIALKSWRVVDNQGHETKVDLFDVQLGVAVTPDLFVLPQED